MSKLKLQVGADNSILRARAVEIPVAQSRDWPEIIDGMRRLMDKNSGIGIAAPQVGISERLFLIRRMDDNSPSTEVTPFFNPEILWKSQEMVVSQEGCLSLPGIEGKVLRYAKVKVKYKNLDWEEVEEDLNDLNAIIFQHELDHLDGILFIDKLIEKVQYSSHDNVL